MTCRTAKSRATGKAKGRPKGAKDKTKRKPRGHALNTNSKTNAAAYMGTTNVTAKGKKRGRPRKQATLSPEQVTYQAETGMSVHSHHHRVPCGHTPPNMVADGW
jgi:hypothetical protein